MSEPNELGDKAATKKFDPGPLRSYEVTWVTGHIETICAHEVGLPGDGIFGAPSSWVTFQGEVDGAWTLVLRAKDADIMSIRLLPSEPSRG